MQGFFTRVLEKQYLRAFRRERGRFRSFLIGSLKHFLANERDRQRAGKRGGGAAAIPLDAVMVAAESRRGRPRELFEMPVRGAYAVSPDGQRFLAVAPIEEHNAPGIQVVLNWTADLRH